MKQAHVRPPECRFNLNLKDADTVLDIVTLKKNQNRISLDRFTPLILLMLAACGGGGGGGGGLGKPRVSVPDIQAELSPDPIVRVLDDGSLFILVQENTTLVSSDSNETVEKLIEKNSRAIAEAVGKSPDKPNISEIEIAPDGKSATYRIGYSNPEFSHLSATVKIELVGDDAEFFRMVRGHGLGSSIEFINSPNYERPRDKDADNVYDFKIKLTSTYVEDGESDTEYYKYFVSVLNTTGTLDQDEEPNILRAISIPENTTGKITDNLFTLNRLISPHNVRFVNQTASEDGSSAIVTMYDKATGRISEVTVNIIGPDAAHIEFTSNNAIQFRTAPDYEKPVDSDGNNTYEFSLVYTGLKQPETTHFRITITDLDEPASSQGRSHQNMEIFHPDTDDYNMPESQDLSPPSEFI